MKKTKAWALLDDKGRLVCDNQFYIFKTKKGAEFDLDKDLDEKIIKVDIIRYDKK